MNRPQTHAEILHGKTHVPGLGPSACPGELFEVLTPLNGVEVLGCAACGVRVAWEPATGAVLNVYAVPEPLAMARELGDSLAAPAGKGVAR